MKRSIPGTMELFNLTDTWQELTKYQQIMQVMQAKVAPAPVKIWRPVMSEVTLTEKIFRELVKELRKASKPVPLPSAWLESARVAYDLVWNDVAFHQTR